MLSTERGVSLTGAVRLLTQVTEAARPEPGRTEIRFSQEQRGTFQLALEESHQRHPFIYTSPKGHGNQHREVPFCRHRGVEAADRSSLPVHPVMIKLSYGTDSLLAFEIGHSGAPLPLNTERKPDILNPVYMELELKVDALPVGHRSKRRTILSVSDEATPATAESDEERLIHSLFLSPDDERDGPCNSSIVIWSRGWKAYKRC